MKMKERREEDYRKEEKDVIKKLRKKGVKQGRKKEGRQAKT